MTNPYFSAPSRAFPLNNPRSILGDFIMADFASADFDLDGNTDLAFVSIEGDVFLSFGNDDGSYGSFPLYCYPLNYSVRLSGESHAFRMKTSDVNNDAKPDLQIASLPSSGFASNVFTLLNIAEFNTTPQITSITSSSSTVSSVTSTTTRETTTSTISATTTTSSETTSPITTFITSSISTAATEQPDIATPTTNTNVENLLEIIQSLNQTINQMKAENHERELRASQLEETNNDGGSDIMSIVSIAISSVALLVGIAALVKNARVQKVQLPGEYGLTKNYAFAGPDPASVTVDETNYINLEQATSGLSTIGDSTYEIAN